MNISARSLYDTFQNLGMTSEEALIRCIDQGIFSETEMNELRLIIEE